MVALVEQVSHLIQVDLLKRDTDDSGNACQNLSDSPGYDALSFGGFVEPTSVRAHRVGLSTACLAVAEDTDVVSVQK